MEKGRVDDIRWIWEVGLDVEIICLNPPMVRFISTVFYVYRLKLFESTDIQS